MVPACALVVTLQDAHVIPQDSSFEMGYTLWRLQSDTMIAQGRQDCVWKSGVTDRSHHRLLRASVAFYVQNMLHILKISVQLRSRTAPQKLVILSVVQCPNSWSRQWLHKIRPINYQFCPSPFTKNTSIILIWAKKERSSRVDI